MTYIITCGDEGVQINEGTRLAVVGAGFRLPGFSEIVKALKELFGDDLRIAASEENDWMKRQLDLTNWDQVNASAQQHLQVLADEEGLLYAGYLPFADPKQLQHGIKGHMVRPHSIHIANKICFTLAGGEQTYNLGKFVVSAEWVTKVDPKLAKQIIATQVEFYQSLVGDTKLSFGFETAGSLDEATVQASRELLVSWGYQETPA